MLDIVNELANSFAKTTGIPFYLYKDEGVTAYHKAMMNYDKDSGVKESTYVYKCVRNAMINLYRKESNNPVDRRIEVKEEMSQNNKVENHPRKRLYFRERLQSLDPDALYVVDLCLNRPDHLISNAQQEIPNGYTFRQELKKHLKEAQWPTRRINTSFANVRKLINTN